MVQKKTKNQNNNHHPAAVLWVESPCWRERNRRPDWFKRAGRLTWVETQVTSNYIHGEQKGIDTLSYRQALARIVVPEHRSCVITQRGTRSVPQMWKWFQGSWKASPGSTSESRGSSWGALLYDAVFSTWTGILKGCSRHCVEATSWRLVSDMTAGEPTFL